MKTVDLSGQRIAAWWVKAGRGWIETLEGLTSDGVKLDQDILKGYAARLARVIEQQRSLEVDVEEDLRQAQMAVGQKQLQLESKDREYDKLLVCLSNVVNGAVDAARVKVDLATRSWAQLAEIPKTAIELVKTADPTEPAAQPN